MCIPVALTVATFLQVKRHMHLRCQTVFEQGKEQNGVCVCARTKTNISCLIGNRTFDSDKQLHNRARKLAYNKI